MIEYPSWPTTASDLVFHLGLRHATTVSAAWTLKELALAHKAQHAARPADHTHGKEVTNA